MPYEIKHDGEGEKAYCVYNKLTDERVGCSATEEEAQAHMRALYANETKEAVDFVAVLKNFFETAVQKLGNIGGNKPRSELKDSDFVFADERKFPVVTAADVSDAVSSWGRYKGKHSFAEFKSRLIALCRRKGFTSSLPKAWGAKKETSEIEVFKDANDVWHWVTVSSTGFIDRDEEIVSSPALAKAVAEAERNNWDLGYLTYWHERPIRVGKCEGRFVEGFCEVETGTWFNDEISEALRKDVALNPELWAISIEFLGNLTTSTEKAIINGTEVRRIWNDISFKNQDRSILPAWRASNTFSMIESQGGVSDMREEKIAFLRERAGDEVANKVVEGVDAINKLAAEAGSVVKEEAVTNSDEVTQQEQSDKASSPAPTPVTDVSSPLNALRLFAATLDEAKQMELAVIIIALDKALAGAKPEKAQPEDETPPDKTGYDTTANDETAKEAASSVSEAAPAPSGETATQDASKDRVAVDAEIASLKQELSAVKENLSTMGTILVELREALVRKQQEDVPRGVLQRASEAEDNTVSNKEAEDAKAKTSEGTDTVTAMAQSIVNLLGGMQ
jgi:hypothetical protein